MTATTATTQRRPEGSVTDRVRSAHLAALNCLVGLSDPEKAAFLNRLAAELAATGAGLAAHEKTPRPTPTAPVPGDAPAGTRVELAVSGEYPVGDASEYRFVAGEVFVLCRPMSAGEGDVMVVASEDGRTVRVPHGNLQLAKGPL